MHITGRNILNKFVQKHPNARSTLNRWSNQIEQRNFTSLDDLRGTFYRASPVKVPAGQFGKPGEEITLTVFNIGNNFRLIAFVDYQNYRVIVRHVLTHDEYMSNKWKK